MSSMVIRDIEECDLPALKSLIVEAFGEGWNFNRFDQGTEFFHSLMEVYLSIFLNASTFGKVAVVDDKTVGAILCAANNDKEKFRQFQKDRVMHTLTLLGASEVERLDIVEHLSVSFQTIGQLLESASKNYDGSLEFIAVAKQAQGLKIGAALWNEAVEYYNSKNVKSIYLISDSACNTGFYDYNGFSRTNSKEAVYNYSTGQRRFDIFLYEYKF